MFPNVSELLLWFFAAQVSMIAQQTGGQVGHIGVAITFGLIVTALPPA